MDTSLTHPLNPCSTPTSGEISTRVLSTPPIYNGVIRFSPLFEPGDSVFCIWPPLIVMDPRRSVLLARTCKKDIDSRITLLILIPLIAPTIAY